MSKYGNDACGACKQFYDLYKQEYEGLIRYASSILKIRDTSAPVNGRAEVAVQEMFVLAWTRRDEVLSCEKPAGWLYNALYYKVLEVLREENKWNRILMACQQHYTPSEKDFLSLELEFDQIVPPEDFHLLYRIYVEGYSYKELCHEMQISKSLLGVRVHRIKEKIRTEWKNYF